MPDLTAVYKEIVKSKTETLSPLEKKIVLGKNQDIKSNSHHQDDVFTRKCLEIVRISFFIFYF